MERHLEQAKHVADAMSLGVVVGSLAGWLPAIAAGVSVVWGLIRIWESKTVQAIVTRLRK